VSVSPVPGVQLCAEILGSEAVFVFAKLNIIYVYFSLDVSAFVYLSFFSWSLMAQSDWA
jgi:hypothetical protein